MRRDNSKETLLAVDIGNTNISCGVYLDGEMAWFGRLFSSTQRTADAGNGDFPHRFCERGARTDKDLATALSEVYPCPCDANQCPEQAGTELPCGRPFLHRRGLDRQCFWSLEEVWDKLNNYRFGNRHQDSIGKRNRTV